MFTDDERDIQRCGDCTTGCGGHAQPCPECGYELELEGTPMFDTEVQPAAEVAMFDLQVAIHALEDTLLDYLAADSVTPAPILADLASWEDRLARLRVKVMER